MEQLITNETFTLAKTAGFNKHICNCGGYPECICVDNKPTQSLLQRWIRDQGIHIEILLNDASPYNDYYHRIIKIGQFFALSHDGTYFKTYEESLETGIIQSLKLLVSE